VSDVGLILSDSPKPTDCRVRGATGTDLDFVCSTWATSYSRAARTAFRCMPRKAFDKMIWARIERLLDRSITLVLFEPALPAYIHAWACFEDDRLHYCYTRPIYRKYGRLSMMISGLRRPIRCTHWTESIENIEAEQPGTFTYAPSLLKEEQAT